MSLYDNFSGWEFELCIYSAASVMAYNPVMMQYYSICSLPHQCLQHANCHRKKAGSINIKVNFYKENLFPGTIGESQN